MQTFLMSRYYYGVTSMHQVYIIVIFICGVYAVFLLLLCLISLQSYRNVLYVLLFDRLLLACEKWSMNYVLHLGSRGFMGSPCC